MEEITCDLFHREECPIQNTAELIFKRNSDLKMSLLEQKNRIFYTTISPFIDSMVENFTKSSLSACFDFVYCAANNYYENESEEIKIYMAQTIMQDKLNFFLQKFMISKSKLYSIEHTEKNHKIRKNDIMHGITFTKPELIHENTQFILGSVANRLLGYSEARGRIYTRHSNLFVYKCDKEDKKVLFKTGRVNRIIGRIHLVVAKDIDILLKKHPDYNSKHTAKNILLESFMIPTSIILKMKNHHK